jgi:hypothetical protein
MKNQGKQSLRNLITLMGPENKDRPINLKQELSIMGSGKEDSETGMVNRSGQMALNILDHGEKIKLMDRDASYTLMETCMMDSGQMTKLMAQGFTSMSMVLSMRESGKMTSNMGKE